MSTSFMGVFCALVVPKLDISPSLLIATGHRCILTPSRWHQPINGKPVLPYFFFLEKYDRYNDPKNTKAAMSFVCRCSSNTKG